MAVSFMAEKGRESLVSDVLLRSALLYQLLIIGEATKRLSMEFRSDHPEIEWIKMTGMRDRLIHGYDQVKLDLVWIVVKEELPALIGKLAPLLPSPDDPEVQVERLKE